jgi:hypothetical protein
VGGVGILAVAAGAVALIAAALAAERWLGAADRPRSAAPVHG